MNKKSITINVVWSVIGLFINTAITMLILPFVSEQIGIEAYGYIALCNNIITYIDLVAATINVYAVRFISIEYHKGNIEKANMYYNSVFIADAFIAFFISVPAIFAVAQIDSILDVPVRLVADVRLLFILTLLNYFITLMGTVFTSAAFIKDILYKDSRIKAEGQIIKGTLLIILFTLLFPHVWYVAFATVLASFYTIACNIKLSHKYIPDFTLNIRKFSLRAIKEIVTNGIWNTVASLGTILNSGIDLLVTNFYLGATKMGQLSVPKTMSNFISSLLTAVTNSFRPQLLQFFSVGKIDELNKGFQTSMKFCGLITCTIFSVFTALGFQFLRMWLPMQDTLLLYNLSILTFFADVFTGFVKPLHYGCVLTGKLKIPCVSNLIVGLLSVILKIFLRNITDGGLSTVAITTVIGNVVYNFVIMPIYVTHIIKMPRKDTYITILRYIVSTFIITGMMYLVFRNMNISNWVTLLLMLAVATIISSIAYILIMLNGQEKHSLFVIIKNRI